MGCVYSDFNGICLNWEKKSFLNPEGCTEEGYCIAEDDPDPSWCQSYESDGNDWDDEVCDYCGEPLGFCAFGCETLDPDFED